MVEDSLRSQQLGEGFASKVKELVEKPHEAEVRGKRQEALTHMQQAVALQPDDVKLRKTLANNLAIVGNNESNQSLLEEAEAEYKRILSQDPTATHGLGYTYMHMGRLDDAIDCFRKLDRAVPNGKAALAQAYRKKRTA